MQVVLYYGRKMVVAVAAAAVAVVVVHSQYNADLTAMNRTIHSSSICILKSWMPVCTLQNLFFPTAEESE